MNALDISKRYLVTGGAGFIGFYLSKALLDAGAVVTGLDNLNDYYEVSLKEKRLSVLKEYPNYHFVRADLADKEAVFGLFEEYKPQIVVNLAAQAGVRYSIDNPDAYIQSNIVGFFHVSFAGFGQWTGQNTPDRSAHSAGGKNRRSESSSRRPPPGRCWASAGCWSPPRPTRF